MPIVRILLVLLALVSPALADDGPRDAAAAVKATQSFKTYIDGVAKQGGRPDLTRPDVAKLLGRIFDLDALNALPPAQGNDIPWLLDWLEAANATSKLIALYGLKPGSEPDLAAVGRNMLEYQDQYALALNFMVRGQAREAVSATKFMSELAPEQRTRIREEGFKGARSSTAEMILDAICSLILSGVIKPENTRLLAAAVHDTRDVWVDYFLPQDRTRIVDLLAGSSAKVSDETTRNNLVAFTSALQAAN